MIKSYVTNCGFGMNFNFKKAYIIIMRRRWKNRTVVY